MPKGKQNKDCSSRENKILYLFKDYNIKWVLLISFWTFMLTIAISIISQIVMRNFDIILAFITLIIIIVIGVVFDTIGIAVAAADEKPFHSMSSNRIDEGKYAVKLVRNAGPVSNFCNDVIGDISGIISGAAGAIIVLKLVEEYGIGEGAVLSVLMSSFIASLTVGGKALGKEIGINKAEKILFHTSKIFRILHVKFGIDILPDIKNKKNRRK